MNLKEKFIPVNSKPITESKPCFIKWKYCELGGSILACIGIIFATIEY